MSDLREHLVATTTSYLSWCGYVAILVLANRSSASLFVDWALVGLVPTVAVGALGAWTYSGRSIFPDQAAAVVAVVTVGRAIVGGDVIVLAPLGLLLFMVSWDASSKRGAERDDVGPSPDEMFRRSAG